MLLPGFIREALAEYQQIIRKLPRTQTPSQEQEEAFQDAMNLRWFIEQAIDAWLKEQKP